MDMENHNDHKVLVNYQHHGNHINQAKNPSKEFWNNYADFEVSEALELVGNEGKYQKFVFTLFTFVFLLIGLLNPIISYAYYVPKFYCLNDSGDEFECNNIQACSHGKVRVHHERDSIVTDYSLYCGSDRMKVATSQFYIFLFAALGTFIVALLSDRIGRVKSFYIGLFMLLIGTLTGILANGVLSSSTAVLTMWTATDVFYSITVVYINEISSNYYRSKVSYFFMLNAFSSIFINFIMVYVTNYRHFYIIILILSAILTPYCLKIIETPFFYYANGNLLQFIESLKKIGSVNQKNQAQIEQALERKLRLDLVIDEDIGQVKQLQIQDQTVSFLDRLIQQFKSLFSGQNFKTLFFCTLLLIANYLNTNVAYIAPQKLGSTNIVFMVTVLSIADLTGYIIILPFTHKIKRKVLFYGGYIIIIVFGILLFINDQDKHGKYFSHIAITLTFLVKMVNGAQFSLMLNYIAELFPSSIRGLASGLIVCISRMSNCLAPVIENIADATGIHPLAISAIPAIFGLLATCVLPETFAQNLKNQLKIFIYIQINYSLVLISQQGQFVPNK